MNCDHRLIGTRGPMRYDGSDDAERGSTATSIPLQGEPPLATPLLATPPIRDEGSARLRNVVFNCLCTALGTGILTIPFAVSQVGILGGITLVWMNIERALRARKERKTGE